MKRTNKYYTKMRAIRTILPVLAIILLAGCGAEENTGVLEEVISSNIEVTQKQFDFGKMELGKLSKKSFHRVIKATGMLDVPPENKSTVSAYFGGYIKHISLLQGQQITKGQVLFTLENPDYIQVQRDFLEAKSSLSYLKSDYERQKELAAENVSSKKTFLKAESDYKITLAQYEALKKKLELMNIQPSSISPENLKTTISVTAPISGYVTSVLATKGMFLNPSDIALTIMNPDHMHAELNIFEQDLTKVKIGQEVVFRLQDSETEYKATIQLINKAIDIDARTVKVHCHLVNDKESLQLTPGMYVEAEIYAASDSAMALPKGAVIEVEQKSYVLVQQDKKNGTYSFLRKEVKVGPSNNDYIEIRNAQSFSDNALFLTNGAFNLIQE